MTSKYSDDELTARVETPGWRLVRDREKPVIGTLRNMLHLSHQRRSRGESPGLIEEIETKVELDMIAMEKLWRYLGLPV
jgi:hypothetical protein